MISIATWIICPALASTSVVVAADADMNLPTNLDIETPAATGTVITDAIPFPTDTDPDAVTPIILFTARRSDTALPTVMPMVSRNARMASSVTDAAPATVTRLATDFRTDTTPFAAIRNVLVMTRDMDTPAETVIPTITATACNGATETDPEAPADMVLPACLIIATELAAPMVAAFAMLFRTATLDVAEMEIVATRPIVRVNETAPLAVIAMNFVTPRTRETLDAADTVTVATRPMDLATVTALVAATDMILPARFTNAVDVADDTLTDCDVVDAAPGPKYLGPKYLAPKYLCPNMA